MFILFFRIPKVTYAVLFQNISSLVVFRCHNLIAIYMRNSRAPFDRLLDSPPWLSLLILPLVTLSVDICWVRFDLFDHLLSALKWNVSSSALPFRLSPIPSPSPLCRTQDAGQGHIWLTSISMLNVLQEFVPRKDVQRFSRQNRHLPKFTSHSSSP